MRGSAERQTTIQRRTKWQRWSAATNRTSDASAGQWHSILSWREEWEINTRTRDIKGREMKQGRRGGWSWSCWQSTAQSQIRWAEEIYTHTYYTYRLLKKKAIMWISEGCQLGGSLSICVLVTTLAVIVMRPLAPLPPFSFYSHFWSHHVPGPCCFHDTFPYPSQWYCQLRPRRFFVLFFLVIHHINTSLDSMRWKEAGERKVMKRTYCESSKLQDILDKNYDPSSLAHIQAFEPLISEGFSFF